MAEPSPHVKALAAFLLRRHSDQLRSIALTPDPKLHYPLYMEYIHIYLLTVLNSLFSLYSSFSYILSFSGSISFAELIEDDPPLAQLVFTQPTQHLRIFDDAAFWAHVCDFYAKILHVYVVDVSVEISLE